MNSNLIAVAGFLVMGLITTVLLFERNCLRPPGVCPG